MSLLSRANFPAIRAVIDIELDEVGLPDSIIQLDVFQATGEADVLSRDPIAASRTDLTEKLHIVNAAVLFTASYIVIALPRILKETFGVHYATTKQEVERKDLAALLRSRANDEIDAVINKGAEEPDRPLSFTITCGGRDHTRWTDPSIVPGW